MKTKQQLEMLAAEIGEAIRNYHKAVEENLLELGHPVCVQDEGSNSLGIPIDVMYDNRIFHYVIDQIKCEHPCSTKVHFIKCDYEEREGWMFLYELGDSIDYVLEAIQWIDGSKLKTVDGDVWEGTANEIYSFCSPEITLYFIHQDGRIEDVDWHETIDDFMDAQGVFAVEADKYDLAIQQIEQHYKESEG